MSARRTLRTGITASTAVAMFLKEDLLTLRRQDYELFALLVGTARTSVPIIDERLFTWLEKREYLAAGQRNMHSEVREIIIATTEGIDDDIQIVSPWPSPE